MVSSILQGMMCWRGAQAVGTVSGDAEGAVTLSVGLLEGAIRGGTPELRWRGGE